jgi:hypothetical protein
LYLFTPIPDCLGPIEEFLLDLTPMDCLGPMEEVLDCMVADGASETRDCAGFEGPKLFREGFPRFVI